jgi:MFS family permease
MKRQKIIAFIIAFLMQFIYSGIFYSFCELVEMFAVEMDANYVKLSIIGLTVGSFSNWIGSFSATHSVPYELIVPLAGVVLVLSFFLTSLDYIAVQLFLTYSVLFGLSCGLLNHLSLKYLMNTCNTDEFITYLAFSHIGTGMGFIFFATLFAYVVTIHNIVPWRGLFQYYAMVFVMIPTVICLAFMLWPIHEKSRNRRRRRNNESLIEVDDRRSILRDLESINTSKSNLSKTSHESFVYSVQSSRTSQKSTQHHGIDDHSVDSKHKKTKSLPPCSTSNIVAADAAPISSSLPPVVVISTAREDEGDEDEYDEEEDGDNIPHGWQLLWSSDSQALSFFVSNMILFSMAAIPIEYSIIYVSIVVPRNLNLLYYVPISMGLAMSLSQVIFPILSAFLHPFFVTNLIQIGGIMSNLILYLLVPSTAPNTSFMVIFALGFAALFTSQYPLLILRCAKLLGDEHLERNIGVQLTAVGFGYLIGGIVSGVIYTYTTNIALVYFWCMIVYVVSFVYDEIVFSEYRFFSHMTNKLQSSLSNTIQAMQFRLFQGDYGTISREERESLVSR